MTTEQEKRCAQCQEKKALSAYSKGKYGQHIHVCKACMKKRSQESNERRKREQEEWKRKQQEKEEERQRWLAYEQRQREIEAELEAKRKEALAWFAVQPERICIACNQQKKAIDFSDYVSEKFVSTKLLTRCQPCHEVYRARLKEKRTPPCPVCQRTINSTMGYRPDLQDTLFNYRICREGIIIFICCDECIDQFLALPENHQRAAIRTRCNFAIPAPQFIYAECDPDGTVRYIGRAGNMKSRHREHLQNIKSERPTFGYPPRPLYSRANWMYDLIQQGHKPHMKELMQVEIAPQVIEYERRYILHGIQQRWTLTNQETIHDHIVEAARSAQIDFLHAPFEELVKLGFFSSHGLEAFIRVFYRQ